MKYLYKSELRQIGLPRSGKMILAVSFKARNFVGPKSNFVASATIEYQTVQSSLTRRRLNGDAASRP